MARQERKTEFLALRVTPGGRDRLHELRDRLAASRGHFCTLATAFDFAIEVGSGSVAAKGEEAAAAAARHEGPPRGG